jgi:spermidine synthase
MNVTERRPFGYGGAVFVSAACGLILEIVAGRLLAPYVGMSLYTWTAIIAVVLAGFSIGHWIGGRLADPDCDASRGARRVALALGLASLSSLACLVLIRVLSPPLLQAGMPPILAIVLLATLLFLLPSLFVGIVSPILTKLAVDAAPRQAGAVIGRMYALGAVGSIAGTLLAGYLFISWIGSIGTVIAVAATYALLALAFALKGRRAVKTLAGPAAGLLLMAFLGAAIRAFETPCTDESNYYCIRIDDFTPAAGRPSRVMVIDHLAHGINDRDEPRLLYSGYLQLVDEIARRRFGPDVRSFVIGGGALTLPRAWVEDRPKAEILVAEIDPAVTAAAVAQMWVTLRPALNVVHADGRVVLQALPRTPRFDIVLGDAFHDISIPAHLVTREFHREIRDRLAPEGIYAVNVIEGGANPRFLLSVVRTLKQDFPVVEVWADAQDVGRMARITFVVLAMAAPSPSDLLRASRGPRREWVRLDPAAIDRRIAAAGVPVLTDDFAPVDRLLSHIMLDPRLAEE